jgi:hypothetical protein
LCHIIERKGYSKKRIVLKSQLVLNHDKIFLWLDIQMGIQWLENFWAKFTTMWVKITKTMLLLNKKNSAVSVIKIRKEGMVPQYVIIE